MVDPRRHRDRPAAGRARRDDRQWTFIAGLTGFAGASALGGAAHSFELLVGARALQGAFAAILAPAALSLLATTFTDPAERGKAFGVYGAIAGTGGAFGLLLGGALTEALDWRWCLYVSILFAAPAAIAGLRVLHHTPTPARPRLDLPGTLIASTGLFALVFGMSRAEQHGWSDPATLALLAAAATLLTAFLTLQRHASNPLLPLRVLTDRNRGGSLLAIATAAAGIFAVFLFLTFYLQNTKNMTALETGLAFLPMNLAIILTATLVNTKILARTGPRPLIPTGMLLAALGMLLLTRIGLDTPYTSHVLPSLILIGTGFGLIIAPSFATATLGVPRHDSGIASAMINTSQQIGGSIGTALLSTLALSAATDYTTLHGPGPQATIEGYATAFWWAAAIFTAGALITAALLRSRAQIPAHHPADPVAA